MVKVTLVYPFFQPRKDNSIFRFPPLGLGYIASALKRQGAQVEIVDCTFLTKQQALEKVERSNPQIIGVYSMFSMKKTSLELARLLRGKCNLLVQRQVDVGWECLSRVDTLNVDVAKDMKRAGCLRVFFGIESGNDGVLGVMNKRITTAQARKAVYAAKAAGLQVGAFFIVGYPGESDRTVLDTVRFASGLPLDYLSFTLPYPIPGTPLYERVKDNGGVLVDDWEEPKNWSLIRHKLLYGSSFSEKKLKFAIGKAQLQFMGRRFVGNRAYGVFVEPFEGLTDAAFKIMH